MLYIRAGSLKISLYVLNELDSIWVPTAKSWRLNERMYGELIGISKQMVKQRHGAKQFMAWRRGYNVKPPHVSSDQRYQKYPRDVRYSLRASVIRSIEKEKIILQRKIPKTKTLQDCMDRTIHYFVERSAKDGVNQEKRVLISSSENTIRGLLIHLCDKSESEITSLEIFKMCETARR
jgi:2,3-bisphosphoglycerate-dependent phosphoglycerate mutase